MRQAELKCVVVWRPAPLYARVQRRAAGAWGAVMRICTVGTYTAPLAPRLGSWAPVPLYAPCSAAPLLRAAGPICRSLPCGEMRRTAKRRRARAAIRGLRTCPPPRSFAALWPRISEAAGTIARFAASLIPIKRTGGREGAGAVSGVVGGA